MRRLALLLALACASCASVSTSQTCLATARIAPDFGTYELRRVGSLPLDGQALEPSLHEALQDALAGEFARAASVEVVTLSASDLEEVPHSEPMRRGRLRPATVLALARRYNLDAILVGTVTEVQAFAPQKLGLALDLVAVETGLPIWSASVLLDAAHEPVRESLEAWHAANRDSDDADESLALYLLSPRRFAEFGAAQLAQVYRRR